MSKAKTILVDFRSKKQTGIHRYSSYILGQKAYPSESYQDYFIDYTKVQRISPFRAILRMLHESFVLPFLLKKRNVFIFHCTKNFGLPLFTFGTKLVLTIQDVIPLTLREYAPNILNRAYYFCNIFFSCLAADKIICISHFTANELTRLYPFARKKIVISYLGVDFEYFNKSAKKQTLEIPGFDLKKKYILTIGGTEPRKNTAIVMDIFNTNHLEEYDLVVIGGEWNGIPFSKEHSSSKRIHLLGKVSEEQLIALYKNAVIFIFPSTYEGFGLPPLEAMACGTPVIAAKASCLPEILNDAAAWFNPIDSEDLLQTFLMVLNNKDFQQELIRKGYEKAKFYSWEKAVAETVDVYKSMDNSHTDE